MIFALLWICLLRSTDRNESRSAAIVTNPPLFPDAMAGLTESWVGSLLKDPSLLKALGTFHILPGKGKTLAELRVRRRWTAAFTSFRSDACWSGRGCHSWSVLGSRLGGACSASTP